MPVYMIATAGGIERSANVPLSLIPIAQAHTLLLPPLVTDLHRSLRVWNDLRLSPGPIAPERTFVGGKGELAFSFDDRKEPRELMSNVGISLDLAGWLVLLDKWMETFVVVARARSVWSTLELAGALPFVTPAFLPPALVAYPPENWVRMARALATTVADGDLTGDPGNRQGQQGPGA